MKKLLILITIIGIQIVQANNPELEICSLIVEGIFFGLNLSYEINLYDIMENLNCKSFLQGITQSVEFLFVENQRSLESGWDELGNAIGDLQESFKKQMKQNNKSQRNSFFLERYINNIKLKLKSKVVCNVGVDENEVYNLLFQSQYLIDQFEYWQQKKYQQYGHSIGKMLNKMQLKLINIQSIFLAQEVTLTFFSGLLLGIQDQSEIHKDSIMECLEDPDQMVIYLENISLLIKEETYFYYLNFMMEQIRIVINYYINGLIKCSNVYLNGPILISDLQKYNELLKDIQIWKFNQCLSEELNEYLKAAEWSWKLGHWLGFGKEIGIFITEIKKVSKNKIYCLQMQNDPR